MKECKDSWRSLRIVFIRNIKQPPSGSKGKKKKWIFLDNMMFLRPYLNVKPETLCSNLPSPSPQIMEVGEEVEVNSEICYVVDDCHNVELQDCVQTIENISTEPSCSNTAKKRTAAPAPTSSLGHPINNKKKKQMSEADKVVVEYIKNKTTNNSGDNHKKQFLLSLLPDLEEMDAVSFRLFRMETLKTIDKILSSIGPTSSFPKEPEESRTPSSNSFYSPSPPLSGLPEVITIRPAGCTQETDNSAALFEELQQFIQRPR